jgi:hypothetical protein
MAIDSHPIGSLVYHALDSSVYGKVVGRNYVDGFIHVQLLEDATHLFGSYAIPGFVYKAEDPRHWIVYCYTATFEPESETHTQEDYCAYVSIVSIGADAPTPPAKVVDTGLNTFPDINQPVPPELKRWVATNWREWPYCGFEMSPVSLVTSPFYDIQKGWRLVGGFHCAGCEARKRCT